MSDEIKAAAEAVAWIEHNRHTSVQWDLDAFQEFYERDIDALLPLAKSYLADLAAREAEERERALPIDREWLLSIGFEIDEYMGRLRIDSEWHRVYVAGDAVQLAMRVVGPVLAGDINVMNRGDLLDLLAGLKIPTKGGDK